MSARPSASTEGLLSRRADLGSGKAGGPAGSKHKSLVLASIAAVLFVIAFMMIFKDSLFGSGAVAVSPEAEQAAAKVSSAVGSGDQSTPPVDETPRTRGSGKHAAGEPGR